MELTEAQYRRIERCFPTQRGNVTLDNLQVLNAILYVAEHSCKWRGLPKPFGNWHTIYTRMNRWASTEDQPRCQFLFSFPFHVRRGVVGCRSLRAWNEALLRARVPRAKRTVD
ncbi:MAG: transposase [Nitrospira sp.]|nr:transposase [Nitrospira sp.]